MKQILVECNPDEHLVKKIGFTKKQIKHSFGKANIFNTLNKNINLLALIDEDPGSSKHPYEKKMIFVEEFSGIKHYTDISKNHIFELKGKLEDWILSICKTAKVNINEYKLPNTSHELHGEINNKLLNFDNLLDALLKKNNPTLLKLKDWLLLENN